MSLGDDMRAMQRHKDNGTLAEFVAGTLTLEECQVPPEPMPHDRSVTMDAGTTPVITWLAARGD
jgi:hypothetical protein